MFAAREGRVIPVLFWEIVASLSALLGVLCFAGRGGEGKIIEWKIRGGWKLKRRVRGIEEEKSMSERKEVLKEWIEKTSIEK